MTSPQREFNDDHTPLAYLLTFRTYGTWLHGDSRGSVDRHHNMYGTPRLPPNKLRQQYERRLLKRPPVRLTVRQRKTIERAIKDLCERRKWVRWAVNARTNHVHAVVTADRDPELVLNAVKAEATRKMREDGCWNNVDRPWAKGGSKPRVWTHKELIAAIDYVLYDQGE
jgi:REP element-mobilizing transposase RayT